MTQYLLRRLLLLPFTLFAIILVNFVILNLAPGDPVTIANISSTGDATRSTDQAGMTGDLRYLQFREHYGLTLPILFNGWHLISSDKVKAALYSLAEGDISSFDTYQRLKTLWGDRARFVMPHLLKEALDPTNSLEVRRLAANLMVRGGLRQGRVGASLAPKEREENKQIAKDNLFLNGLHVHEIDSEDLLEEKTAKLKEWFEKSEKSFIFRGWEKARLFFLETRFMRYLSRVVLLDFGTLRNDSNKTVISEVTKRIKYSLTLAVIPMVITFCLCLTFGMVMAVKQNQWPDYSLNVFFLILFAIPVFVAAPFLIEKCALHQTVPFTQIPIPSSGFHSPQEIYEHFTSSQRLFDTMLHLVLPLTALVYSSLAVQARLSRTAFLEVMRQDFVRTARAKGLPGMQILIKHVGRNGAITIVTSLASSLGVILGGSLIVETIFEINGFGRFFYDAVVNRDFNVVLFSAFAGSFLTLIGYLLADLSYTLLDPRISYSQAR